MTRISVEGLAPLVRSAVPILAILACSCAAPAGTQQSKQSRHEFLAVLIDAASKKPVPSARIILAPKTEGKLECTIDASLTGVSNDRGEVRIQNVGSGDYVVFYNLSASVYPGLQGKVVNYDPEAGRSDSGLVPANFTAIRPSLGQLMATKGSVLGGNRNGRFVFVSGYIFSLDFDLAMIVAPEGELMTISMPGSGSAPETIEISTDLPKPSPLRGTPKGGQ
jgi:hypothetical protein